MSILRGTPVWAAIVGTLVGLAVGIAAFPPSTATFPMNLPLFALAGLLCAIDIATRYLPNSLVTIAGILTWAHVLTDLVLSQAPGSVVASRLLSAILAMIFITGLLTVASRLSGGGLGLGDLKLAIALAPLTVVHGMNGLWVGLVALAAVSIVAGLYAHLTKQRTVAYGPVIVLAVAASCIAG